MSATANMSRAVRRGWRDTLGILVSALAFTLVVRTFLYQPFTIPSGSMKPTLLVGDYMLAAKYAYGYSHYSFPLDLVSFRGRLFGAEPQRGDVVVFRLPRDNNTDYVKRIIGLPGDEVLVRDGIVYINGQALPQAPAGVYSGAEEGWQGKPRFEETLPNGVKHYVLHGAYESELDDAGPFKVPEAHYFVMGDNRDDSIDSRVPASQYGVGFVPYENLIGRADVVFFSRASDDPAASSWPWPFEIRWGRMPMLVH